MLEITHSRLINFTNERRTRNFRKRRDLGYRYHPQIISTVLEFFDEIFGVIGKYQSPTNFGSLF